MEKYLITIGRTSGSGGRRVGIALAKKLGIVCYDEELIKEVAKKSGFSEEIIQSSEEKPVKSFLYSLYSGTVAGHGGQVNLPIEQKVFLAQYNTIKELAEKESGIFVGRCAEYALEHEKNVIKILITADDQDAIAHIEETYGFNKKKAEEFIKRRTATGAVITVIIRIRNGANRRTTTSRSTGARSGWTGPSRSWRTSCRED